MNPLIAALVAVVANLIAAVLGPTFSRGEARTATLGGAAATLGAFGVCVVPVLLDGHELIAEIGPLDLRADTLLGTLLLPLGVAVGALAIALPRSTARPHTLAAASLTLAAAIFALIANNLLVLVAAELFGAAAVGWALSQDGHRAGVRYLTLSATLALTGLALAASQGTATLPLSGDTAQSFTVALLLLGSSLLRLGVAPAHTALTASLQGAPTASAALLATPIGGVAVLARVVQPTFHHVPQSISIATALLAASLLAGWLAITARDLGRSTAWTLAALNGLMVAGITEATSTSTLGGELLWAALVLSEVGFVLVVSMVTRRLGPVDTHQLHGLQPVAPQLSLMFLLVALTIAGVPGTLEFVAHDVLLSGASGAGLLGITLAVLTMAAVGFNALRLYFSVFYGKPEIEHVDMDVLGRERLAILLLVGLVLAGGVAPSLLPLVARAAESSGVV